ncbi:ComEA family DNA-binding protein [Kocuria sp. CPCC 205292]|uniref:helix-hairpin-helix domain-containing protein n=1 Tax=Kocuria cellulosilytica TaxID=3071451 RepID=UPI0034D64F44
MPDAPSTPAPSAVDRAVTGNPAPEERLAALLADAGARPAAREQAGPDAGPPPRPVPGHRRKVAARTRVPGTLLLLALAALAWLAWTVLGPGQGTGEVPETAGRPVLAEADLEGAVEPAGEQGAGQEPGQGHAAGAEPGADPGGGAGAETGSGADPAGPPAAPTPSAGSVLVVHVTGEVARPGVVSVAAGARVVDAVEAAGGLTDAAVTDTVNLAAPVTDGQQVLVPDRDTAPAPGTGGPAPNAPAAPVPANPGAPAGPAGAGVPDPSGTLDLNTATAAELESLPRVGPVLAARIVEFRQQHGGFAAVADLDAVPGIGPTLMEALGPLVSV